MVRTTTFTCKKLLRFLSDGRTGLRNGGLRDRGRGKAEARGLQELTTFH